MRAVIEVLIDKVSSFAAVMTENIEFDFKNEYLLRASTVATNLLTSLEFHPIRCATMLFFWTNTERFRSHSFHCSQQQCDVVLERFGQSEEPAGRSDQKTRKKPKFFPKSGFKQCSSSWDMLS